jgi:DNA mismatch repair ATPase MutS
MGYMEEGDNRIAFMYRLVKGSAKRSFGLNVALLAKIPQGIVDRAAHMSKRLEAQVLLLQNPDLPCDRERVRACMRSRLGIEAVSFSERGSGAVCLILPSRWANS